MNGLITTWPRRLALAALATLVMSIVIVLLVSFGISQLPPWSTTQLIIRLPALAALFTAVVYMVISGAVEPASAEPVRQPAAETTPSSPARPFVAQVVGLEWLNPLQRRDYPTEWQVLWTLGLVKPNRNDDMVRTDPASFTSVKPVAGIANGWHGEETFEGFQEKYVSKLLLLLADRYAMNPHYFYTVAPSDKRKWRELAGIHVEYAIPAGRLDPAAAQNYLRKEIISDFNIGNKEFTDLWSKNTPPDVHVTPGGPNAGFTSLNAALDYLQSHPTQGVWVMNWDAPSFPPKDQQMNENMVLLILAGPQMDTGRDPLAWIGRVATANVEDFEKKVGTTRAIQAWKSAIDAAAQNVGSHAADIHYVIHDAGTGHDASSDRIGALAGALTGTVPEFDYLKQTFNTPALLGEMGAGTALTNVALAIGRANHLGENVLVAGTTDLQHPSAVVVMPPAQLIPIDADKDWFRARGENNAYLPWWGRLRGYAYPTQGFTE